RAEHPAVPVSEGEQALLDRVIALAASLLGGRVVVKQALEVVSRGAGAERGLLGAGPGDVVAESLRGRGARGIEKEDARCPVLVGLRIELRSGPQPGGECLAGTAPGDQQRARP